MTVGPYIRGCGSLYWQVGCGRHTVFVGEYTDDYSGDADTVATLE
jgi:hypothetical protein